MNLTDPAAPAALVHRDAHDTELEARDAIFPASGPLRLKALGLLWDAGDRGLTDDEGGRLMDGDRLTFGRRRLELVDNGWAAPTGERRLIPSGRRGAVWAITDAGRTAYEAGKR